MTANQQRVWEFMKSYTQQNGRPPTFQEMLDFTGCKSKGNISGIMDRLGRLGLVEKRGRVFWPTNHLFIALTDADAAYVTKVAEHMGRSVGEAVGFSDTRESR